MQPRLSSNLFISCVAILSLLLASCTATPPQQVQTNNRPLTILAKQAHPITYSLASPNELPKTTFIPFTTSSEHIFVRTGVNGQDAGLFLLDTGAAIDAIGLGFAGRLELPIVGKGKAMGIAGLESFTFRQVNELQIYHLALTNHRLAGINLNRFSRSLGTPINGIIGFSALRTIPFTLDYPHSRLLIHNPKLFEPSENATRHSLLIRKGLPLVKAEIQGGETVWLIVDSGADMEITLPMKYVEQNPNVTPVPHSGSGAAAGVGGKVTNKRTWLTKLDILGVQLHNVPVSFEASPSLQHNEKLIVGRIGHRLLENFVLTFDAPKRAIYAEWRPNEHRENLERKRNKQR